MLSLSTTGTAGSGSSYSPACIDMQGPAGESASASADRSAAVAGRLRSGRIIMPSGSVAGPSSGIARRTPSLERFLGVRSRRPPSTLRPRAIASDRRERSHASHSASGCPPPASTGRAPSRSGSASLPGRSGSTPTPARQGLSPSGALQKRGTGTCSSCSPCSGRPSGGKQWAFAAKVNRVDHWLRTNTDRRSRSPRGPPARAPTVAPAPWPAVRS